MAHLSLDQPHFTFFRATCGQCRPRRCALCTWPYLSEINLGALKGFNPHTTRLRWWSRHLFINCPPRVVAGGLTLGELRGRKGYGEHSTRWGLLSSFCSPHVRKHSRMSPAVKRGAAYNLALHCDQHYFSLHLKWWCLGPYGWEVNCRQYQRPQGCQLSLLNKATRRRCHHCKKDSPLVTTAHHTTWCWVHSADSYRLCWSEHNLFTFLWICEGNSQNLYKPNPYPKMVESRISFSKEGSTQKGEVPSLGNLQIF